MTYLCVLERIGNFKKNRKFVISGKDVACYCGTFV